MPELAYERAGELSWVSLPPGGLSSWLHGHVRPLNGELSLDFESSGRHPDGNWATDAAKCEPEARVSIASMAWQEFIKDICPPCYGASVGVHTSQPHEEGCVGDGSYERIITCSVAIPFDQGWIGGKKGRYIKKVTKKTPVLGWEYLPHTESCESYNDDAGPDGSVFYCKCAPWNFGVQGWVDLKDFWASHKVNKIDYFNAKYDMWIALAGLRDGAHKRCEPDCVGWQHMRGCMNSGINLAHKLGTDVMIREGITDPATPDSLDSVGKKFFGIGKDNGMDEGLKANGVGLGKRYDLVDWRIAGKYAGKDAWLTLRAKLREDEQDACGEIDPKDYPIIAREHEKIKVLFNMERRGVGFDVALCREQGVKMHAEVESLVGSLPFKDTSIAAGNYFFGPPPEGLGLVPVKMTEGGKPSIDAEVVARLTHEKGEAGATAKLWAHIANMKSVCSKWYDAWPHRAGKDGRLRTNFWQCAVESDRKDKRSGGAISGRLSADRVQLQGLPQDWRIPEGIVGIRALIRAKPEHQVWEFDASNAEVRVTAWLTRCVALANVINSGVNIHSANTVNIFGEMLASTWPGGWPEGWPHDAFKRADGALGFTTQLSEAEFDKDGDPVYVLSEHPDWKKVRTSMKRGIFGTIYASGVRTLKSQIDADLKDDIPERQIKGFMDALNGAYPEIRQTSKGCERKVDVANGGPGFVRLVSGRRRVFGWGERTYKALNACVQGGVAEMMSELMISVDKKFPGMLINQVHDSLWLEIPDERVEEVNEWVRAEGKRIFEAAFQNAVVKVAFKFDGKRIA